MSRASQRSEPNTPEANRRAFLKTGAATVAATALAASFDGRAGVYAAGDDMLKVGLVGCGGRGTGAAGNALHADKYTRLVAVGDTFRSQIDSALNTLKNQEGIGEQVDVPEEQKFVGLDAYRKVIDAVDVVLLATPPGFRPVHLRAAVEAGKHIFTEKPMATDAPGVRSVIETVAMAKEKGLGICAGFCWRYDNEKRAFFERVHGGAIGDVLAAYGTYLTVPVKPMPPAESRPADMTDAEWIIRNWYNFNFLSGDGLVEQAVHTVDWLAWTFGDHPPESCTAVGGRQVPSNGGNIFDHIEVNYVWESGARGFLAQRQTDKCYGENKLYLIGSKGMGELAPPPRGARITGSEEWRFKGSTGKGMYQNEHDEFFLSLRDAKPINDGDRMWQSTLMAIMGRMAAYTGQQITWDMALNSKQVLMPEIADWTSPVSVPPMALPGLTEFV
jgi:predicted dehydrogenase